MERKTYVIVVAAGHGTRMGGTTPKQFLDLGGKPILRRTIEVFTKAVPDIKVMTVLSREHMQMWKDYCLYSDFDVPQDMSEGGITRFHSVRAALSKVPDGAIVAIHDGVRPLVSTDLVSRMFSLMCDGRRALIPIVPIVDSLKAIRQRKAADGSEVFEQMPGEILDRSCIWGAQTPQLFLSEDIKEAYDQAYDIAFTDDASVAEKKKIPLTWIRGERYNLKITTPEDLKLARSLVI